MRRLLLGVLVVATPALAQMEAVDAGEPLADAGLEGVDAGTLPPPSIMTPPPPGVGRHFSITWDPEGPKAGDADVQLWVTPSWGRADGLTAIDLRAGVMLGLPSAWAAGVFVDATPTLTGALQEPGIDGRLTLRGQNWIRLCPGFSFGTQAELGAGLKGVSATVLLAADISYGPLRLGINVDGYTETPWSGESRLMFGDSRFRQTAGLSYSLVNGFSFALELQNRLAWVHGGYTGDAFFFGPSIAYRGTRFWVTAALLPQVAAMKPESRRGVGDPLELVANERFTVRLSMGLLSR